MMEVEFYVTISLDGMGSGDVCSTIEVSDEEYEAIRECCLEDDELQEFPGLEDLCDRIIEDVKENSDVWVSEDGEDLDPEDAEFYIQLPDEIYDEVQEQ